MLPVSTSTPKWHDFSEDEFGDDRCDVCRVQVTLDAHMTFTLLCPTAPCLGDKNPDDGCAFVARPSGTSVCMYCGRIGERQGEESEPFAGFPSATTQVPY